MRNGSDDDHLRNAAFGPGPFAGVPSIAVTGATDDDEPFALGEFVAALRRPADFGPGVDTAVMDAIRLAPAPLVVVPGSARRPAVRSRQRDASSPPVQPVTSAPLPRAWRWFTQPRAVRVTPLGALAAAGIAVAAVFGLRREAGRNAGELASTGPDTSTTGEFAAVRRDPATGDERATAAAAGATPARDTVYFTRFMLVAPGARQVSLVGDFNAWDHAATPLRRVASQGGTPGVWTIDVPLTAGRYSYLFLVDGRRWVADPARPRAIGDDDFGSPNSAVTVGGGDT